MGLLRRPVREPTAEVHEPETQILLTLGGSFVYRVVFVQAGQTSADSHPTGAAVSYLVLTPGALGLPRVTR